MLGEGRERGTLHGLLDRQGEVSSMPACTPLSNINRHVSARERAADRAGRFAGAKHCATQYLHR
jgi:hypothetical protein